MLCIHRPEAGCIEHKGGAEDGRSMDKELLFITFNLKKAMKHILVFAAVALLAGGCKKDYRYNPDRAEMLGN
jgi:hypothetical protein